MNRTEFERVTPESVGISSAGIARFLDSLESGYTEMHGLMIMRHGKVCAEGWWAPYAPGLHHMCASLTKTYMGTAIGIAITKGLVKLDDHLTDIFPEYMPEHPGQYFDQLTLRHVLTMGTGMTGFPSQEGNWVKNFIAQPLTYQPGTAYFYNSVGSTFLGKVILKLTGKDVFTFLGEELFDKIGIDKRNVDHGIAPEGQDMWAWRTVSTTEDNLRLMKLYANGGVWEGERILSEEYVALATTCQNASATEEKNNPGAADNYVGYGYQMWMCQRPGAYRADGAAGQFSIVVPDLDMIISINENAAKPQQTLDNVWAFLKDAVSEGPLAEDEAACAALRSRMTHLAIAAPKFAPYSPRKASASGVYQVESGSFDLYCSGMMAPGASPVDWFRVELGAMEGTIEWHSKDRTGNTVSFAMDGSRRFNKFASPWQFAEQCWANGWWEGDTLTLELLWPENNSGRSLRFTFDDCGVTVAEEKRGMPGVPGGPSETRCSKR